MTKNSWNDRYAISFGPWAGWQAIPETYFTASEMTAEGEISGVYVHRGWTVVPDEIVDNDVLIANFMKQHDNKLAFQNPGEGKFALVKGGKLMTISGDRAGLAALTLFMRGATKTVNVPKETWEILPKDSF